MKKSFTLIQMVEAFIGREGRLVSMSKSCGPAMSVYNSNMVVGDEVIWYGDIDLDLSKEVLCSIAKLFDTTISIYSEHDLRVFSFEVNSNTELKAKWKEKIIKTKPAYTTSSPELYYGQDYYVAKEESEKRKEERIKERRISFGSLTPSGTEWKWYNAWYYNIPHKAYRIVKFLINNHICFPLKCASYEEKGKIRKFFKSFFKEFGYVRIGIKEGQITLKDYLFNH
jgi:hypothetical protein